MHGWLRLASTGILTSCQPHRIASGQYFFVVCRNTDSNVDDTHDCLRWSIWLVTLQSSLLVSNFILTSCQPHRVTWGGTYLGWKSWGSDAYSAHDLYRWQRRRWWTCWRGWWAVPTPLLWPRSTPSLPSWSCPQGSPWPCRKFCQSQSLQVLSHPLLWSVFVSPSSWSVLFVSFIPLHFLRILCWAFETLLYTELGKMVLDASRWKRQVEKECNQGAMQACRWFW